MSPSSILGSNTSTNIAGRPGDRRGVVVRNPYTTNVVQTKSIQATLAALTKDTNALNDGAKQQETKHKSLLRELNDHFRPKYNQLVNDIRDARSSSGNHQQTMAHIKRERERLENQLKEEQRQLKDACETETKLIHSEETHKRKYVTDMRGLNKEFESLLKTQHDERSLSFLEAWLHQEKSGKLPFDNRCRQLLNKVLGEEASVLEDLERAFAEFQDTIKNIRQADEQIQGIRAQVLNHPATQATEGVRMNSHLHDHRLCQTINSRSHYYFYLSFVAGFDRSKLVGVGTRLGNQLFR